MRRFSRAAGLELIVEARPAGARRGWDGRQAWARPAPRSAAPSVCGCACGTAAGAAAGRGLPRFSTTLTREPVPASRPDRRGRARRLPPSTASTSSISTCAARFRGSYPRAGGSSLYRQAYCGCAASKWEAWQRASARGRGRDDGAASRRWPGGTGRPAPRGSGLRPARRSSSHRRLRNRVTRRGCSSAAAAPARLDDRVFSDLPATASRRRRAGAQRHPRVPGAGVLPPRDRRAPRGPVPAAAHGADDGPGGGETAPRSATRRSLGSAASRPPALAARRSPARRLERLGRWSPCDLSATAAGWWPAASARPVLELLEDAGAMPLPPYIHERLSDPERYQTTYAHRRGLRCGADGRPALHAGPGRRPARRPA